MHRSFAVLVWIGLAGLGFADSFEATTAGSVDAAFQRSEFKVRADYFHFGSDGRGGILWGAANGATLNAADNLRLGLVRTDARGNVDSSIVVGPRFSGIEGGVAGPGAEIYLAVNLPHDLAPNGEAYTRITKILPDGRIDAGYRSPAFDAAGRFMTLQPDGKLLVTSGGLNTSGTGGLNGLQRLNRDGSIDASFHPPQLTTPNDLFADPVVDGQGRILIGGVFTEVDGVARPGVARLNPNGTLDASFVPSGFTAPVPSIRGVVIQKDGRIVIGGRRMTLSGQTTRRMVLRLQDNGAVDPAFEPVNEGASGTSIRSLIQLSDGSLAAGGTGVLKLLANGGPAPGFKAPTAHAFSFASRLLELPNGHLLVGTGFQSATSASAERVVCLNPDGSIDPTFHLPNIQQEVVGPLEVHTQPDGKLLVAGMFDTHGKDRVEPMIRLLPDGSRDLSFQLSATAVTGSGAVIAAAVPVSVKQVQPLPGGGFYARVDSISDPSFSPVFADLHAVKRFTADGREDQSWTSGAAMDYASIRVWKDRLIGWTIDSPSNVVAGVPVLKRHLSDGSEDRTFQAFTNRIGQVRFAAGTISSVAIGAFEILDVDDTGRVLAVYSGGPAGALTDAYPFQLIRLKADGGLDPTFKSDVLQGANGRFSGFPEVTNPSTGELLQIEAYAPMGTPFKAATFTSDGGCVVAVMPAGLSKPNWPALVRLKPDGQKDPTFSANLRLVTNDGVEMTPSVHSVKVDTQGRIWITGDFTQVQGVARKGLARLLANGALDPTFEPALEYVPWTDQSSSRLVADGAGGIYVSGSFRRPGEPWPFALHHLSATAQPLKIQLTAGVPGGPFRFEAPTHATRTLVIQSSRDLISWTEELRRGPGGSVVSFVENAPPDPVKKFYRATYLSTP